MGKTYEAKLVELQERIVHAGLIYLKLFLLLSEGTLKVRITISILRVNLLEGAIFLLEKA